MSLNLIMGARNGAKTPREENDFYATHPDAVRKFIKKLKKDNIDLKLIPIWECACGKGHISETLKEFNYKVYSSDLVDRKYKDCSSLGDFTDLEYEPYITFQKKAIITNPPFKLATKFCYSALKRCESGDLIMFFLKVRFLEGKTRKKLFEEYPPKYIYLYSERQQCALNGDFETYCKSSGTEFYCWVIWEKGYQGETITRWI